MNSNNQGNGIFVVLIIVSAIAFGVYSVSSLINSESRMNYRAEAYQKARQAVESLIQSGVADLHARIENSGAIPTDELSPTNRPLSISTDFLAIYNDPNNQSNLVIPDVTKYTSISDLFSQDTEIIGGMISPSVSTFIDPYETGNELDDQKKQFLFKRTVEIFGKATVNHPSFSNDVTVYARQLLEIREIPLFSYAIFYNLPMEIAPGPDMDVYGKVHVNGDAWFQSGGGSSLNFHGPVTIAGDVYHGRRPGSGKNDSPGEVNFSDSSENLINMKENVSWPASARDAFTGTWLDSAFANFRELAEQIWDGNLQTKDHSVGIIELPGLSPYEESNTTTKDVDPNTPGKEAFNSAYTIIEPTLDKIDIPSANDDPEGYKKAKAQRAAEKNKFSYLAGLTIEVSNDGSLSYYSYQRDSYNNIVYDGSGAPIKVTHTPTTEIAKNKVFSTSSNGEVVAGLYDKRQDQEMDLVELDISALKDLVHSDDESKWGGGVVNKPSKWWTGVVYVKFPQQNASSTRLDNVNPASSKNWGVKLVNGDVIPNPEFAQTRSIYGTSIATNQVMYVEGNFNSDGNVSTGSPTGPDSASTFNQEGQEAPAALAADAITFLSENWKDANSSKSLDNRVAQPTEVSAAILTGLVPSGKNGSESYSGGVENFPRFLENWQGKDFVMRGSIVAMFESEIATKGWGKTDVYKAPTRKWGFHSNYNETPPQGPRLTAYRGRDLQLLNRCEYHERISENWGVSVPAGVCP